MKLVKNLLKFYDNYKEKKLRLRCVKLSLKTGQSHDDVTYVAKSIYRYINDGS